MKRKLSTRLLSFVLVVAMVMSFAVMPVGATEGEGGDAHSHTWVNGVCSDTTCNATCTHEGIAPTESVTASTCLVAGTKTLTCVCGVVISTETLPLADHVYNEETGRCTTEGCTAEKPAAQNEEQPASCIKTSECEAENHETDCPKHPDYVAPVTCDKTAECKAEEHAEDCAKAIAAKAVHPRKTVGCFNQYRICVFEFQWQEFIKSQNKEIKLNLQQYLSV